MESSRKLLVAQRGEAVRRCEWKYLPLMDKQAKHLLPRSQAQAKHDPSPKEMFVARKMH